MIPSVAQVKNLFVSFTNNDDDDNNRNQLQNILSQITCLSIFYVREHPSRVFNILSFDNKDLSAFFLDLISTDFVYNNDQCVKLSQLSFVTNCKALAIVVENRTCVTNLISALNNLQALTVVCQDDTWNEESMSDDDDDDDDELLQWFQQQLPSIYIILRRNDRPRIIAFWIH
ncbi:unnamed protein product [Adineta steineri]|uniref:Uncharacterized protein n=2 Tax=Adineta steineri TaxID=433720 RepID=A0A813ZPT5_9BILA|nr:unnamed protein product [Adineta steineri]CAF1225819.1 unnamed protein product [Adineta steineri]